MIFILVERRWRGGKASLDIGVMLSLGSTFNGTMKEETDNNAPEEDSNSKCA